MVGRVAFQLRHNVLSAKVLAISYDFAARIDGAPANDTALYNAHDEMRRPPLLSTPTRSAGAYRTVAMTTKIYPNAQYCQNAVKPACFNK